jgi:hypothetical protein
MCPEHWRRVPLLLKAAVNGTWSNRQAALGGAFYREAVEAHERAKRDAAASLRRPGEGVTP